MTGIPGRRLATSRGERWPSQIALVDSSGWRAAVLLCRHATLDRRQGCAALRRPCLSSFDRRPLRPSLTTKSRPYSRPFATRRPWHWRPPGHRTRMQFVRCSQGQSLERSSGLSECHWAFADCTLSIPDGNPASLHSWGRSKTRRGPVALADNRHHMNVLVDGKLPERQPSARDNSVLCVPLMESEDRLTACLFR
jgi:hypothetical protein